MSTRGGEGPSAHWLRLLGALLPRGEREHVREELEALYRMRVAREGRRAADRWLRWQVLAFVPSSVGRLPSVVANALAGSTTDLRRAARSLVRAPATSVTIVLTLAVGIGASTLMFTVVDGVLVRSLPFDEPDRLVRVWDGMSRAELDGIRDRARTLADVRGWVDGGGGVNLEHDGEAYRLTTTWVEPGLFELLGARPLVGRLFAPEEAEPGRGRVTLLGEELWRSMFAADRGVVGSTITLDGRPYQVVGVLPSSWSFPDPADRLWLPLDMDPTAAGPFWGSGGVRAVARLAPGATAAGAQAELRAFAPEIAADNPVWTPAPGYRAQAEVTPLRDALVGDVRRTLLVLLSAVGVVLLVVCANVSSLLVARAIERGPLVAVRTALGASRGRVVREALAESVLLGLAGALLGALAAAGGLEALRPFLVGRLPRAAELSLDGRVLLVAGVVGLVAGIVAGWAPALRAVRRDPGEVLRGGGRGGGPDAHRRQVSGLLVGAQVAAAVVLVTGAALLVRTLAALGGVDPGFRPEKLITAQVSYPSTFDREAAGAGYAALVEGIEAVPGVEGAVLAGSIPFGPTRDAYATFIEDVTRDPNELPVIDVDRVGPGYFDLMGIPLLEGRALVEADRAGSPLVAVVDERMARTWWPEGSAVGRRIRYPWAGAPWIEVVGVVGSVADDDLASARRPRWYVPLAQSPTPNVTLVLSSTLPGVTVVPDVRRAVARVDPRLPVSRVTSYRALMGESLVRTRLAARVLLTFALTVLLLGCLGVYGMAAHMVRERRRDIGVRMALGANAGGISAAVLRSALRVAVPGATAGLLLAAASTRALSGMLFGVSPLDPLTFTSVPGVMLLAALLAVWIPARRAAAVDPMESLRER